MSVTHEQHIRQLRECCDHVGEGIGKLQPNERYAQLRYLAEAVESWSGSRALIDLIVAAGDTYRERYS